MIFVQNRLKDFSVNGLQSRFLLGRGFRDLGDLTVVGRMRRNGLQGEANATLRGGRSRRCYLLPFERRFRGSGDFLGAERAAFKATDVVGAGGWPAPRESAMWLSRGYKMPLSDMAAPLLPRPAEELKMAASRKCGAERNARQRGKRRPSGNAARPTPPGPDSSPGSRRLLLLFFLSLYNFASLIGRPSAGSPYSIGLHKCPRDHHRRCFPLTACAAPLSIETLAPWLENSG